MRPSHSDQVRNGVPRETLSPGATATPAPGTGPGLVDDDASPVEAQVMQLLDRLLGVLGRGHLHEGVSLRAAGVEVRDDPNAGHRAGAREDVAQLLLGGRIGNVPYKESCPRHAPTSLPNGALFV